MNPASPLLAYQSSNPILKEMESFCLAQLERVERALAELPAIKIQTVPAQLALHAAGKRRPSLSQIELEKDQ